MNIANLDTNIAKDKAALVELQTLRYQQLCQKGKLTKVERKECDELFMAIYRHKERERIANATTDELWEPVMRDPFH